MPLRHHRATGFLYRQPARARPSSNVSTKRMSAGLELERRYAKDSGRGIDRSSSSPQLTRDGARNRMQELTKALTIPANHSVNIDPSLPTHSKAPIANPYRDTTLQNHRQ